MPKLKYGAFLKLTRPDKMAGVELAQMLLKQSQAVETIQENNFQLVACGMLNLHLLISIFVCGFYQSRTV